MDFVEFLFSRKFLKHLLLAILITVVLIWAVLQSLSWYTKHDNYIIVPDFRGMYLVDVAMNPDNRNYQFSVIDSIFDPDKPRGAILSQDPYHGSKVKKNRTVYLTVTTVVPEKVPMPDLQDLTLRQAQSMLSSAGLRLGKLIYTSSFDEDAVQNQFMGGLPIKPGVKVDKGSRIDLMVGMGSKAAISRPDTTGFDSIR